MGECRLSPTRAGERACSPLPGATGPGFRPGPAEAGARLRVVITASNSRPRSLRERVWDTNASATYRRPDSAPDLTAQRRAQYSSEALLAASDSAVSKPGAIDASSPGMT